MSFGPSSNSSSSAYDQEALKKPSSVLSISNPEKEAILAWLDAIEIPTSLSREKITQILLEEKNLRDILKEPHSESEGEYIFMPAINETIDAREEETENGKLKGDLCIENAQEIENKALVEGSELKAVQPENKTEHSVEENLKIQRLEKLYENMNLMFSQMKSIAGDLKEGKNLTSSKSIQTIPNIQQRNSSHTPLKQDN